MGAALKGALFSKTIWFNVIVGFIGIITDVFSGAGLGPEISGAFVVGGNLLLRAVTDSPLGVKGPLN